jgi:hypothetical protein
MCSRTCREKFEGSDALRPIFPRDSRTDAARGNVRVVVCKETSGRLPARFERLTRSGGKSSTSVMEHSTGRKCSRAGCSLSTI